MDKKQIGITLTKNVKYIREQLQLTQKDFAASCELSRPNLAAIEEGRSLGGLETVLKISRFTNITINTLITTDLNTAESVETIENKEADTDTAPASYTFKNQ